MSSRVSPDGMYYWDGQSWVSTLSADGRHRWNGTAWVAMEGQPYIAAPSYAMGTARRPTSWTRPLQFSVAAWYVWSILYSLALPFWMMQGFATQFTNQFIATREAQSPDLAPPPPGFVDQMNTAAQIGIWVGIAILIAVYIVLIVGAWRRWTWIFYTVLVLLGLSALFLPVDLFDAVARVRSTVQLSSSVYVVSFVTGLPGVALVAWMLIALVTRGPWAMKRVS